MIIDPDRWDESGQSLIELILVLPVLLLFLGAVVPFLSSGIVTPWLDEKLWLRHFFPKEEILRQELKEAHGKHMVPRYFGQGDLEETTNFKKWGIPTPIHGDFFPGSLVVNKVLANLPDGKGICIVWAKESRERTSRSLAMLTMETLTESDIPLRTREISVMGIFPGKIRVLENFDFHLFHLDLNALPGTDW